MLSSVSHLSREQLLNLFLTPEVLQQYHNKEVNEQHMRARISQAKGQIETIVDDFLKQIIVTMENNKRVIFASLDLQLEKFSSFLSSFKLRVDDFVRDSLNQLTTAQQQFDMQYSSQQFRTDGQTIPSDLTYPTIDQEIEHLRIQQKRTEMQESVYLQIKKNFSGLRLQSVSEDIVRYLQGMDSIPEQNTLVDLEKIRQLINLGEAKTQVPQRAVVELREIHDLNSLGIIKQPQLFSQSS